MMVEPIEQPNEPIPEFQAEVPADEPKPPSWLRRALNALFSSETRVGRILRPTLRWVGTIVGLTSLGIMLAYLLLYQPLVGQMDTVLGQLAEAQDQIQGRDARMKTLTAERDSTQKNLTQAQTDLSKAKAQNDLLLVMMSVNNARVGLVNKDGASAKSALDQALIDLTRALPVVQFYDKAVAEVIKTRLELASKELVIDPQAAQVDLDKLQSDLLALRNNIFK